MISNRNDEIEIKADSFYPSFSFMYDAQELFIIGGEEKSDELTIDVRK